MASSSSPAQDPPEAILVERETLRKARVEVQELPMAVLEDSGEQAEADVAAEGSVSEKSPRTQLPGQQGSEGGVQRVVEKTPSQKNSPAEERAEVEEKPQIHKKIEPRSYSSSNSRENFSEKSVREVITEGDTPEDAESPAPPQPMAKQESSINRKALDSTNEGVKPSSRRFVRGILHPLPVRFALAAFWSLLFQLSFYLFFVSMILFVLGKVDARQYWWLVVICPVAGLIYLISASQMRCRVCGQKEFWPSGARKHVKRHRFLLAGPIFSTAIHLLTFKWIHCMFCGTAVRIKK